MKPFTIRPVRMFPLAWTLLLALCFPLSTRAQYTEIDFASNQTDHNLVNPWGVAILGPDNGIWVSDNGTGKATQYDALGNLIQTITIPVADDSPRKAHGVPTGQVANPQANFPITRNGITVPSAFIYAGFDGTISAWNPNLSQSSAVTAIDNSEAGAKYTGLAIVTIGPPARTFLYAADFAHNEVDVYDDSFRYVKSFTDKDAPPDLRMFGIQAINGNLYVTLGSFAPGQGGAVDVFLPDGTLLRRLAASKPGGALDGPWGLALAPGDFGALSNRLLVGNLGSGHITALDLNTGKILDLMRDTSGVPITIPGLWALQFGGGNPNVNGPTNLLYFTAGPKKFTQGLFGAISSTSGG